jgi:hypothetical protein
MVQEQYINENLRKKMKLNGLKLQNAHEVVSYLKAYVIN